MKKILLTVLAIICIVNLTFADNKKSKKSKKYISGINWNFFTEFGQIKPLAIYREKTIYNSTTGINTLDTVLNEIKKPITISFFTLGMTNHFLIKNWGREKSLSIQCSPSIGISSTLNKMININIPVFLQFNIGNVSTYESKKDKGFTVGLGLEFVNAGLKKISDEVFDSSDMGYKKYHSYTFIQPTTNIGYRFFSKNGNAREINIKYSIRPTKIYDELKRAPSIYTNKTYILQWFRLSFVRYFNY